MRGGPPTIDVWPVPPCQRELRRGNTSALQHCCIIADKPHNPLFYETSQRAVVFGAPSHPDTTQLMPNVQFTMLNSMADRDFERALDRHVEWALEHLDLKGGIFGKDVVGLSELEANQARQLIDNRGLSVYCMSTTLFDEFVEAGEDTFRADHLAKLDSAIEVARVLQPHFVRLLAAKTRRRAELTDSVAYLAKEHTWLIELYREAIGRLVDAGQRVTVENECHDCIMSTPEEIHAFFDLTDGGDNFSFTWDVQNLWQMGTFPSLDV